MCINDLDSYGKKFSKNLYGRQGSKNRAMDLIAIPCIPKQLTLYNKHLIDKECIADY
jgi:hypothetical protein